jgi:hypothetical protein
MSWACDRKAAAQRSGGNTISSSAYSVNRSTDHGSSTRQQRRIEQNLHDSSVACVKLVQFVLRLQFTEHRFYFPATPIQRCYIRWHQLLSRYIRYILVFVVGVLVADADDTESFRIQRSSSFVLTSLELRFDFNVDVLPLEITDYVVGLLAFQGNGALTTPSHTKQVQKSLTWGNSTTTPSQAISGDRTSSTHYADEKTTYPLGFRLYEKDAKRHVEFAVDLVDELFEIGVPERTVKYSGFARAISFAWIASVR